MEGDLCLTAATQNPRRDPAYPFALSAFGRSADNVADDFVHTFAGHLLTRQLVHAQRPPFRRRSSLG